MTATNFYRGQNPLKADDLNTAFGRTIDRAGDVMSGPFTLYGDPVGVLDAVTKQYVDNKVVAGVVATVQVPVDIRTFGAACDGVTDDTAAWTTAFASPSGTVIRIPQNSVSIITDGNFRATGSRSISIVGDGRNSVLRFKSGLTQANQFFTWFGGSTRNVRLENFTFDYNNNAAPASLFTIFGVLQVTGFRMVNVAVINCATNIYMVNPNACSDLVVDGCYFQVTTPSQAVQSKAVVVSTSLGLTTNVRMTSCVLVNTNTNFSGANRIYFAGNDVSGWGVGAGIATDAQCSNHVIIGNDFHDSQTGQDMYGICPNGIEQWSSLTTVANNRCWNNSGHGIAIGGADCTVIGNSCWDNGTSLGVGGTMAGISLVAANPYFGSNCLVIGNKCWDSGVGRQNYGFKINNSGITNVTLDGNIFKGSTADWLPSNATFLPTIDYTPRLQTATSGNTQRSTQDRASDTVNALEYGADRTGVADSTTAIQAAINAAVAASPHKSVYIPTGTYLLASRLTVLSNTSDLFIRGDAGQTKLIISASNSSNNALLGLQSNCTNVQFEGIIFDGATGVNTGNNFSLVGVSYPSFGVSFTRCWFQNTNNTALNVAGEAPVTANINAQANTAQAVLSFASVPSTIKPGAYVVSSATIDPDMYVISTTGTTVTLNRNLTDTTLNGSQIGFTHAFTTNADALYGATVLPTADTTGLSVGETVYIATIDCFRSVTRITAISTNTSVTIDKPLLCKLPSGSNVAAMGGHANFRLDRCRFIEIGQQQIIAGTRNYNTFGVQASGQAVLKLRARSGSNCTQAGVFPGQVVGASPPAGVPTGALIVDGVTRDTANNAFSVTLNSNLTGSVADNTPIPFLISAGGAGYGCWLGWGAPFANINAKFLHNHFEHTWAACVWAVGSGEALFEGNTYVEDQMEFRDPVIAPSPCINLEASVNARVIGDNGTGATGCGIEAEHPIGLVVSGCTFNKNGSCGISIAGGANIVIDGCTCNDNGQFAKIPFVQDYDTTFQAVGGIVLSGSATTSQPGTMSNVRVTNNITSDTQTTPTQQYGVRFGYRSSSFTNLQIAGVIGTGNIVALIDTNFPAGTVGVFP